MGSIFRYHAIVEKYTILPNRTILDGGEEKIFPIRVLSYSLADDYPFQGLTVTTAEECRKILDDKETSNAISSIEVYADGLDLNFTHSATGEQVCISVESLDDPAFEIAVEGSECGRLSCYRIEHGEECVLRVVEYKGSFIRKVITFDGNGSDPDMGERNGYWAMIEEYDDV